MYKSEEFWFLNDLVAFINKAKERNCSDFHITTLHDKRKYENGIPFKQYALVYFEPENRI